MLRKRCKNCGEKVNSRHRFCPHCGYGDRNFEDFGNDWGMLGKDDLSENAFQLPFGFDNLVNSLMKNLTKQLNESYENPKKSDSTARSNGISISISSSGNSPPKIQINSPSERKVRKVLPGQFSEEDAKRFSQLKKEEPKTVKYVPVYQSIIDSMSICDLNKCFCVSLPRFHGAVMAR